MGGLQRLILQKKDVHNLFVDSRLRVTGDFLVACYDYAMM